MLSWLWNTGMVEGKGWAFGEWMSETHCLWNGWSNSRFCCCLVPWLDLLHFSASQNFTWTWDNCDSQISSSTSHTLRSCLSLSFRETALIWLLSVVSFFLCISPCIVWVKVCFYPNWSNYSVPQSICHFADNKIINVNGSHIFLFSLSSCLKIQIKAKTRANSCSVSGVSFCVLWEASF